MVNFDYKNIYCTKNRHWCVSIVMLRCGVIYLKGTRQIFSVTSDKEIKF